MWLWAPLLSIECDQWIKCLLKLLIALKLWFYPLNCLSLLQERFSESWWIAGWLVSKSFSESTDMLMLSSYIHNLILFQRFLRLPFLSVFLYWKITGKSCLHLLSLFIYHPSYPKISYNLVSKFITNLKWLSRSLDLLFVLAFICFHWRTWYFSFTPWNVFPGFRRLNFPGCSLWPISR